MGTGTWLLRVKYQSPCPPELSCFCRTHLHTRVSTPACLGLLVCGELWRVPLRQAEEAEGAARMDHHHFGLTVPATQIHSLLPGSQGVYRVQKDTGLLSDLAAHRDLTIQHLAESERKKVKGIDTSVKEKSKFLAPPSKGMEMTALFTKIKYIEC